MTRMNVMVYLSLAGSTLDLHKDSSPDVQSKGELPPENDEATDWEDNQSEDSLTT